MNFFACFDDIGSEITTRGIHPILADHCYRHLLFIRREPPLQPSLLCTMENNNWRPAQGETPSMEVPSSDWRSQLQPEARQRIVNKIMDTLRRHLPLAAPEGMTELKKIAVRFEEKIYAAAVNQSDYLRKISLKMLSMETMTQQNTPMNSQPGDNDESVCIPHHSTSLDGHSSNQEVPRYRLFQILLMLGEINRTLHIAW
ncbi:hypothetical protein IEQ34_018964 [Dendrobium chrysotoxum]|uniref:Mediator complex subunit 15 KIX domain-containing protein n=1 Tax=Dendrobium chrysotoxum TaxID=161865 RepID=A0AAV7FPV7_DENCH|nr:hypothetical protein IEQ34_018964 [Dendrobium chrysotoxum]